MENNKQEKELDLLDLIRAFWNFLVDFVFRPLGVIVKIGVRRWHILLISILVGIFFSIMIPNVLYKKHKSEIIVKNYVATSSAFMEELQTLSKMNRTDLSSLLDMEDVEGINNLIGFKPHYVIAYDTLLMNYTVDRDDEYIDKAMDEEDQLIHPTLFSLEVLAKDDSCLNYYTDAILKYLNTKSKFLVKMNENRLATYRQNLVTYKNEMKVLDSLRNLQYFTKDMNKVVLGISGETINLKDQNNKWIQEKIMFLKSEIVRIEQTLENESVVVEPLTSITTKEIYENHPFRTLHKYALFFFALSYICIIISEFRGNIREWINQKD